MYYIHNDFKHFSHISQLSVFKGPFTLNKFIVGPFKISSNNFFSSPFWVPFHGWSTLLKTKCKPKKQRMGYTFYLFFILLLEVFFLAYLSRQAFSMALHNWRVLCETVANYCSHQYFSDLSKMPHFLQTSRGKTLPTVPWLNWRPHPNIQAFRANLKKMQKAMNFSW